MRYLMIALFALTTVVSTPSYAQEVPAAPEVVDVEEPGGDMAEDEVPADDVMVITPEEGDTAAKDAEGGVPQTDEEAVEALTLLVKAVQEQNWVMAVGLFLGLLVYVARRFKLVDFVSERAAPWITLAVASSATIATGLLAGNEIVVVLVQGILAGLVAVGGVVGLQAAMPEDTTGLTS